ncbi:MAG: hypothetical protein Q8S21_06625 [Candidatus Paracaedibacteraceae bacterium]|nr:hypothetical protein [Candidatus Paracaedibacteraceae bacterium]
MKLAQRISLVMCAIAISTMTLLTILMHFKYHSTQVNLVNERYGVTSAGISQPLKNAILLGIKFDNLRTISELINEAKNFDKSILDIIVFKNEQDTIVTAFETSKRDFSKNEIALFLSGMRASKTEHWKGTLPNDIGFSGTTIRDVANQDRASILILYDLKLLKKNEAEEINSLYKRLLISLVFIILLNFISGYKNTRIISNIMHATEQSVKEVMDHPDRKIDLCVIKNPEVRTEMRELIERMSYAGRHLAKIESLIKMAKIAPEDQEKHSSDKKGDHI